MSGGTYMGGLLSEDRDDYPTCVTCGRRLDSQRFGPTVAECDRCQGGSTNAGTQDPDPRG